MSKYSHAFAVISILIESFQYLYEWQTNKSLMGNHLLESTTIRVSGILGTAGVTRYEY